MKRFIGYARVSTDKQTENTSFDNQKREIDMYIEKHGGILLDMFQESFTGKEDQRPILLKAVEACQNLNAVLIVSKLDRLSRSMRFIINFQERFKVDFVVVEFPDRFNKHTLFIFSLFAEMERDMISDRTKEALRAKMANGSFNPTGENLIGVKRNPEPGRRANMEKTRNFRHYTFKEMERICQEYHQKFQTSPSMEYMVAQLNTRYNKTCRNKEWTKQALYNFLSKGKKSGEIENYVVHLSNWDFLNPAYQPPVHEGKNESLIPEKDLGKTKIVGKTDLEVEEEMRELKRKVDPKDIGETKIEVVDERGEDKGEEEDEREDEDIGETDLDLEVEESEESEESDLGVEVISSDSDDWEMEILDTYSFQ